MNLCFLRSTRVHNANGKSIGSAIFAQFKSECRRACRGMPFNSILHLPMGDLCPHLHVVPWVHPTEHSKRYLDRFSRFYAASQHYVRRCGLLLPIEKCGLSVCLLVCHSSEPCKTAEPIEVPLGLRTRVNYVLDGVQIPHRKAQFSGGGEEATHCKVQGHSAVICAKRLHRSMPFGLWAWIGPLNHVLDGSRSPMRRGNFGERGDHCKV